MERKISRGALESFALPELEDFQAKKFWHTCCSKSYIQSGVPLNTFFDCLEALLDHTLAKADRMALEATLFPHAKEFDDGNNLVVTLPTFKDFYQRFGNIKEVLFKVKDVVVNGQRWFHGDIDLNEATRRLNHQKKNGLFLLRFSKIAGRFSVGFVKDNQIHHYNDLNNIPGVGYVASDGDKKVVYKTLSHFIESNRQFFRSDCLNVFEQHSRLVRLMARVTLLLTDPTQFSFDFSINKHDAPPISICGMSTEETELSEANSVIEITGSQELDGMPTRSRSDSVPLAIDLTKTLGRSTLSRRKSRAITLEEGSQTVRSKRSTTHSAQSIVSASKTARLQDKFEKASKSGTTTLRLRKMSIFANLQLDNMPDLAFLRQLDLTDNGLTEFPPILGSLKNLKILCLDKNQLTVLQLPASLQRLTSLSVSDNKLKSIENIASFPHLQGFYASGNEIEEFPKRLKLDNLERLDISKNKIAILDLQGCHFAKLEEFYISANIVSEISGGLFKSLPNIVVLDFSENIIDDLPPEVSKIRTLEVIKLSGNPLKKLPADIVEQGTKSLIRYLEQTAAANDGDEGDEGSPKDTDAMIIPGTAYLVEKCVKHAQETYVGLELCTQNLFFDYSKFFYNKKVHANFIGVDPTLGPIAVSISKEPEKDVAFFDYYRGIVRSSDGDKRCLIPVSLVATPKNARFPDTKTLVKALKKVDGSLKDVEFRVIQHESSHYKFLKLESTLMRGYQYHKFAVLYCRDGQTIENDMYSNPTGSREFNDFLNLLGETIKLRGCTKYSGGLNADGHDGETTIHTTFRGIEVAFHVSTLIPHSASDSQQIRRKRHLGNDNVLIIFKEGKQPFHPANIRSHFNNVIAVVQPEDDSNYKIGFVYKSLKEPCEPHLPEPPIFEKTYHFREFLLTKLINADHACYASNQPKTVEARKYCLEKLAAKFPKHLISQNSMAGYVTVPW